MSAVVSQVIIQAVQRALPSLNPAVTSAFLTRYVSVIVPLLAYAGQKGIELVTHFVDEFVDDKTTASGGNGGSPPSSDDEDDKNSDDRIIDGFKRFSETLPKKGNEKYNVYVRESTDPQQAQIDFDKLSGKTTFRGGDTQVKKLNDGRGAVLYDSTQHMPGVRTIAIQKSNGNVIVKFRYPTLIN